MLPGGKVENNYNNNFEKNANGRNKRESDTYLEISQQNSIDHLIINEPYNALNVSDVYSNNIYDDK